MNKQLHGSWEPRIGGLLVSSTVVAAVLMGVLLTLYPFFPMPALPEQGISPKPEVIKLHRDAGIAFYTQNFALLFSGVGFLVGLVFAATTAAKQILSVIVASIAGGLSGLMGGYLIGYYSYLALSSSADQSLVQSSLFHFLSWVIPVSVVVLVISGLHNSPSIIVKQTIATLVIVLIAAVGYGIVGTLFFPNSNQLLLVPEPMAERIAWALSYPIMIGLGLAFGLKISSTPETTKTANPDQEV